MKTDISSSDNAAASSGFEIIFFSDSVHCLCAGGERVRNLCGGQRPNIVQHSATPQDRTTSTGRQDVLRKIQHAARQRNFQTCVVYLSEVRRLHRDRVAAEAAGLP